MSDTVVEIHVPLTPAEDVAEGEYAFLWIDAIEEHLFGLEEGSGRGELYDDGEESDGEYIFFVWNAPDEDLVALARKVSQLPGVPAGAYAVVTDTDAEEFGVGRKIMF